MAILIDTNVLLNGVCNPFTSSRRILANSLITPGAFLISETSLREAEDRLRRCRWLTLLDLRPALNRFLAKQSLTVVADVDPRTVPEVAPIRGADQVIAATAVGSAASLCTNNVSDFRKPGVSLRIYTPSELLPHLAPPQIHDLFFLAFLTPGAGTVFAEFSPNWVNAAFPADSVERFFVFDLPGFGSLFFEASSASMQFTSEGKRGAILSLPLGVVPAQKTPLRVALTYEADSYITLSEFQYDRHARVDGPWDATPVWERWWVGCSRAGTDQLSGALRWLVTFPRPLTLRATRRLARGLVDTNHQEHIGIEAVAIQFYGTAFHVVYHKFARLLRDAVWRTKRLLRRNP
jgi:hypothetical protein